MTRSCSERNTQKQRVWIQNGEPISGVLDTTRIYARPLLTALREQPAAHKMYTRGHVYGSRLFALGQLLRFRRGLP